MPLDDDLRAAGERYAASFDGGSLPAPPARRLAVVTCMDARVDPVRILGLALGDAHVIRNAGAIADEAVLRALALSHHLLGTQEAIVIGHTGCGLLGVTNEQIHERIGAAARGIDFQPFDDLDARVRASVEAIRRAPLLPEGYGATGLVFEVETGRLRELS